MVSRPERLDPQVADNASYQRLPIKAEIASSVLEAAGVVDEIESLIGQWLLSVTSEHSRRAYRRDIRDWLGFIGHLPGPVDPLSPTKAHADLWLTWHRGTLTKYGKPPAEATLARMVSVVASFYAYLRDEDITDAEPIRGKNRPKMPRVSTTIGMSHGEARAFRAAAEYESNRNRAILELLLGTGMRVSEMTELRIGSMRPDTEHWALTVYGKGEVLRVITLPPGPKVAIDSWLAGRADLAGIPVDELEPDALMFPADSGEPLTQSAVYRLIRRVARAAGIPSWRYLSPHSMRHTCATLALDAGAPIREVQHLLGHKSHDTTVRYDRARGRHDNSPVYDLAAYLATENPGQYRRSTA